MTISNMLAGVAGAAMVLAVSGANAQMTPGTTAQGGATGAATAPSTSPAPAASAGATAGGGVAQGATVYDTQGGTVGSIATVDGDYVTLATAKNKVRLPRSSFANGPQGPVIAMTAAQLDQEAAKAGGGAATSAGTAAGAGATGTGAASATSPGATAKPSVTAGAAVSDTSGGSVGKIADVKGDLATLELTSGSKVQIPTNAFGANPDGGLVIAMSAAQLSAAASAAGGGASAGGKAKTGG